MRQAVDRYLAMRQAAGFDLVNAEYLLRSFACAAAKRGETHVRAATAIMNVSGSLWLPGMKW